jgi:toxin ParE1/3/4
MTVNYSVVIVKSAERDIKHIYNYIKKNDCIENAKYVFNQLLKAIKTLEMFPQRGANLAEFYGTQTVSYREISFKVYRIIYQINENKKTVVIQMVIDGRRNLKPILEERCK